MSDAAISCAGLTKDFGAGRGLFRLDLEILRQEIFGYLGPNGAGKTTTIRCLMDLIRPTAGSAAIFGLDSRRDSVAIKKRVGYLPGELAQFGGLTGAEVVAYVAGMRGGVDRAQVTSLCHRLDLDLGVRFREYSRGNKQKLGIVLAFMNRPDLLILDEPTGGLDPLNQQEFYRIMREARDGGATVFFSSHILSEVEDVCDRVGIIRHGNLIRLAALDDLHDMRLHQVEVQFVGEPPLDRLRQADGVEDVAADDGRVTCTVKGGFDSFLQALAGHSVLNLKSHEPTLEEIFLNYYKEEQHHLPRD